MEMINVIEATQKYDLYLKIVTSVRNFDSYNSFYNIYDVSEEPVRRIAVLTKNAMIEEVYDSECDTQKFDNAIIVDENIWIKEYSLLDNPSKIDLSKLEVPLHLVQKIIE